MLIKKITPPPKIDLFENILSVAENISILTKLIKCPWHLAFDNSKMPIQTVFNYDSGFNYCVFNSENNTNIESEIKNDAIDIFKKILIKANIKDKYDLIRLSWNLYFKTSKPKLHKDTNTAGFKSIVYDLHTTDGATIIGGHMIADKMGQAKMFDSEIFHRGVVPKKDNIRFNLNIIFKINK